MRSPVLRPTARVKMLAVILGSGPLAGAPGRLPELVLVAHFLWRVPGGSVTSFYRTARPDVIANAEALPTPDSGATLADAVAALDV